LFKAGQGHPSPWQQLRNRIELVNDDVVHDMLRKLNPEQSLKDIPNKQKQSPVKRLSYLVGRDKTRNESMVQAYWSEHSTLTQAGEHFGVSYATVSRAVKRSEGRRQNLQCMA
jgi:DNA-directed RNA polymerase specialized sigma subunit